MSLLELFWGFLKVGCFSFGGAYAAIPIIRDIVRSYGWLTDEALEHMIASRPTSARIGEASPARRLRPSPWCCPRS